MPNKKHIFIFVVNQQQEKRKMQMHRAQEIIIAQSGKYLVGGL
jgi:hypothetical protein